MAEQKVKLTELPTATDTVDTAQLLINQNSTDQKLAVTHFLRAKNNLSELTNVSQARANLDVPSVDDVNDKLTGFIDGAKTFLAGASLASRSDFIWDEESKSWYYWKGTLPKDVPAASNPASTGGVGDNAWGEVGSDSLRDILLSNSGASLVETAADGSVQEAVDDLHSGDFTLGYRSTTIKDRLDVSLTTKAMGAVGDGVTDDTIAVQSAIDALAAMTRRATLYIDGRCKVTSLTVPATLSLHMVGNNVGGASYNRSALICSYATGPTITCNGSACTFENIQFVGASNDTAGGGDTTQTAILFTPGVINSYNCDGLVKGCGFAFFNKIFDLRGRNLKLVDNILSNSAYGVWIGTTGIPDFRGLDIQGCRFHYMASSAGNETTPNSACSIYIGPNTNFFSINITGNFCDGGKWFLVGAAAWGVIDNNHFNAQQTGVLYHYNTGMTLGTVYQRTSFSNNVITHTTATAPNGQTDSVYLVSGWGVDVLNNTINNAHRRAINSGVSNARIIGNTLIEAGFITGGFPVIESNGANSSIMNNVLVRYGTVASIPSVGIKVSNFTSVDGNRFPVGFGATTVPEWDTSGRGATLIYGVMDIAALPSEEWGTAAPTSGRYLQGSKVWNVNVLTGGTLGWVCVASGTPGTWKGFGGVAT